MFQKNYSLDLHTLGNHIISGKELEGVPKEYFKIFTQYFESIVADAFHTPHIDAYIQILQTKSRLRSVLLGSINASDIIIEGDQKDAPALIDKAYNTFCAELSARNDAEAITPPDILPETVGDFIVQLNAQKSTGNITCYNEIDMFIGGLFPGRSYIIAGRPAMGKTTFSMNIVENMVLRKPESVVLVFSLEMSAQDVYTRCLSSFSRLRHEEILQKELLSEMDKYDLEEAYMTLRKSNILIYDNDINLSTLIGVSKKIHQLYKRLDLIVIDYIQLMAGMLAGNRQQDIADISRSVKLLARELGTPIIIASQLNRNVDERNDRRPILSDLRESGALEQDADVVFFIYRDEVYNQDSDIKGKAEIIIGKNRHGSTGSVYLNFKGSVYRFSSDIESSSKDNGMQII